MAGQHPNEGSSVYGFNFSEEENVFTPTGQSLRFPEQVSTSPDHDDLNAIHWENIIPMEPHHAPADPIPQAAQPEPHQPPVDPIPQAAQPPIVFQDSLEQEPTQAINEEDDIYSFLNNLSPLSIGIPELMSTSEPPQAASSSQHQELPMENPGNLLIQDQPVVSTALNEHDNLDQRVLRKPLSREQISSLFHLPIKQAADVLKVGETHLRKCCREVGIMHWPNKRLESLNYLINNIRGLDPDSNDSDEVKLKAALPKLENTRQEIRETPDLQLDEDIKEIRKIFYKVTYKRRMGNEASSASAPTANEQLADNISPSGYEILEEEPRRKKRSKPVSELYP